MTRKSNFLTATRLLICTVVFLAMSKAAFAADTAVDFDNQIITIALTQEPPQLNSMKTTDQVSGFILPHVMEGLLRYDRRGKIVPGVAEKWEVDRDGATFWLRKNAKWSDGKPVTAHDFVFAWQNALAPVTASEYAFILYPIKNGEKINKGEINPEELAARAVNDFELRLEFERPTSLLSEPHSLCHLFSHTQRLLRTKKRSVRGECRRPFVQRSFQVG